MLLFYAENIAQSEQQKQNNQKINNTTPTTQSSTSERERIQVDRPERNDRERVESPPQGYPQNIREVPPPDTKPWGYSGMDLINSGAAFWQNYSGK